MNPIDVTSKIASVKFHEGNEYRFAQDFRFFKCIPSDVSFYPVKEHDNNLFEFIGDRHGMRPAYGLQGSYGNGSIYVYGSDIPHLHQWFRENLLPRHPLKRRGE